ncbi:2'-5' RNA ligase family protein [Dactylosporangium sp. CS-033363]|uniref:2'-5' RNA ligase family protein n=1 Tax=Dactylosporangium sp. CS-033363 TaxID=3239935 RepID=UPI003D909296
MTTDRVLAIFPDLDTAGIERFRARWDPLAAAVPAHITIAFPFTWPGTALSLAGALRPVLAACPPFPVELTEPSVWEDEYLFLLLGAGHDQVRRLHDSVYGLALPGLQRPARFVPHMTIGRAAGIVAAGELSLPVSGLARSLTVYRRDGDGTRTRELDLPMLAG